MVTIARLRVAIEAGTGQLMAELGKAEARLEKTKRNMESLRGPALAMVAAGAAVGGAVALSIKAFAEQGDAVQKMALRTGFGTEALSELKFAAEQSGASLEGMEKGFKRMASFVEDGRSGLTETTRALDALGLSVGQLDGLSPEATFDTLAMAIANVEDPLRRSALAQDAFGRAGADLLPLLSQGAAGLEALRQEARDLGIVFSQDAANKAAEFNDSMNSLSKSVDGFKFLIAKSVIPTVTDFIQKITSVTSNIRAWAEENPRLFNMILKGTLILGGLLAGMGAIILVLPFLISGITALGVVFNLALSPVTLIIIGVGLAIAALVGAGILLIKNWNSIRDVAKFVFTFIADNVLKPFIWFYTEVIGRMLNGIAAVVEGAQGLADFFGRKFAPGLAETLNSASESMRQWDFDSGAVFDNVESSVMGFVAGAEEQVGKLMGTFKGLTDANQGFVAAEGEAWNERMNQSTEGTAAIIRNEMAIADARGENVSRYQAQLAALGGLPSVLGQGTTGGPGSTFASIRSSAAKAGGLWDAQGNPIVPGHPLYERYFGALGAFAPLPLLPGTGTGARGGEFDVNDPANRYLRDDFGRAGITVHNVIVLDGREIAAAEAEAMIEEGVLP